MADNGGDEQEDHRQRGVFNKCDCGWIESPGNPHRKKCPQCGRTYLMTEKVRHFGH